MNKSVVLWYLWVHSQDVSSSLQGFHKPWKKTWKNKNFIVRALKTKQVGNVFRSVAARKIRPW